MRDDRTLLAGKVKMFIQHVLAATDHSHMTDLKVRLDVGLVLCLIRNHWQKPKQYFQLVARA